MLLKPRKPKRLLTPICLILVVLASVGTVKRDDIKLSVYETWETFLINDAGISSHIRLTSASVVGKFDAPKGLLNLLELSPDIIISKLTGFDERPPIERLDIDIKFVNYKRILADRTKALQEGALYNPTEVKAKLRYQGETYKAKVRLKGDLVDHWRTRSRLSLRVKKSGDGTILGFKRFSLHRPQSRSHPYDAAFQAFARRLGVLAPEHKFLRVYVNGENWGIMDVEEHMSKELLERQGAKESLIIRFGDQESWRYSKLFPGEVGVGIYRLSDPSLVQSVSRSSKMLADEINRQRLSYVIGVRDSNEPQHAYDIDAYAAAWVAAQIWNGIHTLEHHNSRNYFNPYTLRLEPLTTDQGFIEALENAADCEYFIGRVADFDVYKTITHLPDFRKSVVRQYEKAASLLPGVAKDFQHYQQFFPLDRPVDTDQLGRNLEIIRGAPDMCFPPSQKPTIYAPASPELAQLPEAETLPHHVYARHFSNGDIEFANLLPDAVQINSILVSGNPLPGLPLITVPGYLSEDKRLTISTELEGIRDGSLQIVTEYQGVVRHTDIAETLYPYDQIYNPLQSAGAKLPAFIQSKSNGGWVIKSGLWEITKPVVLDGSLQILPGAQISFSPDAYLIVKGHLDAVGSEDARIILRSSQAHWKGLYVFRAKQKSHMAYVDILETSGVTDGILALTGGVNFYQSDIDIFNSKISGTIAEDALNIVESTFLVDRTFIGNTTSDALDGDFSNGTIRGSDFKAVGGDAIDFSGSQITVIDTVFSGVRDKAISVGEGSVVDVQGGVIGDVGVGVASKDGSKVTISGVQFGTASVYTLMSYMKKDFYGSPDLNAMGNTFPNDARFARQAKSGMVIDGEPVEEQDLDVESLYATGGVMAK